MSAGYELRDYQQSGIQAVQDAYRAGQRQVLLCMPTGAGKTLTAAEMLARSARRGKRILWLTDREELAEQASEAFTRAELPHGFIVAGTTADKFVSAWVGTIQSFLAWRKPDSRGYVRRWTPETVDFVIVDEAHRAQAASFQQMLACYPNAYVLGLTATPMRGDGQGLGKTFKAQVTPITMRELLDRGVLVSGRYFVPSQADYSKLQSSKSGDYTQAQLTEWADANPQLVGDAVENFARVCPERRFVAFPPDIKTSVALRDRMNAAGFSCIHIDGGTPKEERRELMREFRAGEVQGLTSVNIAIEGLDVPDVSAVVFMRPTKSERIWVQAAGRGLRSSEGKRDCVILDHAGTLMQFGPAEDFVPPALHSNDGKKTTGKDARKREKKIIICEGELGDGLPCGAALIGTHICPECGHVHHFEAIPEHPTVIPGQLEELTTEGRRQHAYELGEKRRWYAELLGYCANRGKSPGQAFYLYQEKFNEKPGGWQKSSKPTQPSAEVLGFVKSRNIAYARRMEAQKVNHAAD